MSGTIDKLISFFNAAAIGYFTMKDMENYERCIKIVDMLKSDTFGFED